LVNGILKAFEGNCPTLGEFLDERLVTSPHLDARLLKRAAIRKVFTRADYGFMVADIWQDKNVLKSELFMENEFEKRINLKFFDIPKLHEFSKEGEKFFDLLENTQNYSLFRKKSI
jgi:hypothetical protein